MKLGAAGCCWLADRRSVAAGAGLGRPYPSSAPNEGSLTPFSGVLQERQRRLPQLLMQPWQQNVMTYAVGCMGQPIAALEWRPVSALRAGVFQLTKGRDAAVTRGQGL